MRKTLALIERPAGILFDMGGTLLTETAFDRRAARQHLMNIARNPNGVTMLDYAVLAQEFDATFWAKRDETLQEFPVKVFWRLMDERLGLTFDLSEDDVELEFWKTAVTMTPEPGIHEVLEAVARAGIPAGVVSNSGFGGRALCYELEKHGLLKYFRFVMSTADYGVRKPHPMIFLTAAAKLGNKPENIWFFGDSHFHDIRGAAGVGMKAFWYNPKGEKDTDPAPHVELRHWDELAEAL